MSNMVCKISFHFGRTKNEYCRRNKTQRLRVRRPDRNFVAPRLTELKEAGKVRVIGKRACIMSGKMIAVWERVDK